MGISRYPTPPQKKEKKKKSTAGQHSESLYNSITESSEGGKEFLVHIKIGKAKCNNFAGERKSEENSP